MMDKKAKEILFKTYWTSGGWTDKDSRHTDPKDFEYAKSKGLMFDPIVLSRKKFKSACEKLVSTFPVKKAAAAFLSSLTNKRADHRSGIASYTNLKTLLHEGDEYFYDIDEDDDINVLSFERIKWGGVRHSQSLYNFIDLTILQDEVITEPTKPDIELFKNILRTIDKSNPTDTASVLRENLKQVWTVSKDERGTLLEILGCCGILETLNHDRKEPHKHDWNFVTSWRGEDKYNKQKVKRYFGKYGVE
jgi:hypothetical protein